MPSPLLPTAEALATASATSLEGASAASADICSVMCRKISVSRSCVDSVDGHCTCAEQTAQGARRQKAGCAALSSGATRDVAPNGVGNNAIPA